ncbi:hypothetical protein [Loktanella sp. M215]|uniref:hypothetical protein n=1 Tax=Loktanella sp. M215 TaxID=2675431 RepID=UPI001F2956D3|nr:hypothetical protein [Loktanella sp. M215]MCF7699683.1 hypothetical protein [Loktanella sp. M215]
MMGAVQTSVIPGAVLLCRVRRMVKTLFHIDAHRCATTMFQAELDQNRTSLICGCNMPRTGTVTHEGLFAHRARPPGHSAADAEAARRVANRRRSMPGRCPRLLVSKENMIGTPRGNLGRASLSPGLSPRLARFRAAFAGQVYADDPPTLRAMDDPLLTFTAQTAIKVQPTHRRVGDIWTPDHTTTGDYR